MEKQILEQHSSLSTEAKDKHVDTACAVSVQKQTAKSPVLILAEASKSSKKTV